MNPDGFRLLTLRETECLRLVARLYNDKQIARELSIEPSTVKTFVGRAMRKLDVTSRAVAARALVEHEACPPQWGTDRHGGQPSAAPPPKPFLSTSIVEVDAGRFEEARATFDVDQMPEGKRAQSRGRVINASWAQRLALVVATTFLMVVVAIASVPLSDAVQRVAERISPGSSAR